MRTSTRHPGTSLRSSALLAFAAISATCLGLLTSSCSAARHASTRRSTSQAESSPSVSALPPSPFEDSSGLAGYRDADGKVVIVPRFTVALAFHGEVAGVADDDGWIFIDRGGRKLATAFVFDNAVDDFTEDRARIVENGRIGFIASSGRIVIEPVWSFADRFSGGRAAVCEGCERHLEGEHYDMTGGKWGYIDANGKVVIAPRFEAAGPFVDGQANVRDGGREFAIGTDGKPKD